VRTDEGTPSDRPYDPSMVDPFAQVSDGSSLSGHERNVLFLSSEGKHFDDVSGISGADDPADGRAVALIDYDRDGWQDLVVVNVNAPQIQLFRNEVRSVRTSRNAANVLAIRLQGGNETAQPAAGLSNRDGIGARLEIELPEATLVREVRAGEGFASQNSATMLVGLGDADEVKRIRVYWPSGRIQETGPVPAGTRIVVREAPEVPADAFAFEPYALDVLAVGAATRHINSSDGRTLAAASAAGGEAPLRILTTMATWCERCKGELPQLTQLRGAFDPKQVALLGVPVDEDDDASRLDEYEKEYAPAYELLKSLPPSQIEAVRQTVLDDLRIDALPAAIATDARGRVIRTMWGVPSISEVKELLREVDS
jgi:thiol-disulfide isomerase/thioredoxin